MRNDPSPPNVCRDSCGLGIVAKDADAPALAELGVFIVEILRRHEVGDFGPLQVLILSAQEGGWENHRVEGDVVFGHELVIFNIVGILQKSVSNL